MRLRLYTMGRELGTAELLKGVTQHDVVRAMREGQLYFNDADSPAQTQQGEAAPARTPQKAKTA